MDPIGNSILEPNEPNEVCDALNIFVKSSACVSVHFADQKGL